MSTRNKEYLLPREFTKVGKFLAHGRKSANLTQREVSMKLGYSSAQFISNFERGIALPPLKKMKMLVDIYDLSPNKLIELTIDAERNLLRKSLKEN